MQRGPKPLLLVTAMYPAREHDVTSLQMIPATLDGSRPGFGCFADHTVPEADASADPACTGFTRSAGWLARPARPHAVVLHAHGPRQARAGTFRKSIPPGTAGGRRLPQHFL